jgi:hypothetical protein
MKLQPQLEEEFIRVQACMQEAIEQFEKDDKALIERNVNERSITHKLAEHLQKVFDECGYDVDCEYNRRGEDTKRLKFKFSKCEPTDIDSKTVYPDIIVHKRGKKENLLVIEAKKSGSSTDDQCIDVQKLIAFTKDARYKYRFGLFLLIDVREGQKKLIDECWFHCGERIDREIR